jgi:predicted flap endonuclease-1-like 5' DNA nuclease
VFLLCLNVAHALIELVINGPSVGINILSIVGGSLYIPANLYFLISLSTAAIFFGYFCTFVRSKDPGIFGIFDAVEAKLEDSQQQLEEAFTEDMAKFSVDQISLHQALGNIEKQIAQNREGIQKMVQTLNKHDDALKKQSNAIEDVTKAVGKMEIRLPPKRCIANTSLKDISGIDKKLVENLWSIGITNVEELAIADRAMIASNTGLPESQIMRMQATAQLLLIPGINLTTVRLLIKAGVDSVDELASLSPLQLLKKISSITEGSKRKPNLEEVSSYVSFAKYYSGCEKHHYSVPMISFGQEIMP